MSATNPQDTWTSGPELYGERSQPQPRPQPAPVKREAKTENMTADELAELVELFVYLTWLEENPPEELSAEQQKRQERNKLRNTLEW